MKQLDEYRHQHEELSEIVAVLRRLLKEDELKIEANAHLAHEKLCNLADKLKMHLSGEDKELYPKLLVDEDPSIKAIAWGFIRNESPLRKQFDRYAKKWLKASSFEYSEDFVAETNDLLDALMKRINKEEKELFPRLEQAKG